MFAAGCKDSIKEKPYSSDLTAGQWGLIKESIRFASSPTRLTSPYPPSRPAANGKSGATYEFHVPRKSAK